jgi:hypothetical protein
LPRRRRRSGDGGRELVYGDRQQAIEKFKEADRAFDRKFCGDRPTAAWRRVVFAADCIDRDGDGEVLICPECAIDYAECLCPGPHQQDEFEYQERRDGLYARRRSEPLTASPVSAPR